MTALEQAGGHRQEGMTVHNAAIPSKTEADAITLRLQEWENLCQESHENEIELLERPDLKVLRANKRV